MYIFAKTVRDYRFQVLVWGGGLALLMLAVAQSYTNLFKGADRPQLIEDYKKTAGAFSFLIGNVYGADTFGAYLVSELQGIIPALLSIFSLMAGSALIRGEEEKGSLDLLLSTPFSRKVVLFQRYTALMVALAAILSLSWLGLLAGATIFGEPLEADQAALAHLNWFLLALVYGSLALVISQLTSRKAAAGWTGGLLAATYLLNNLSLSLAGLKGLGYLSPFYYEALSRPLLAGGKLNWGALALLAFLSLLATLSAGAIYEKRDHNDYFTPFSSNSARITRLGVHTISVKRPKSIWLANSFVFGLGQSLPGVLIWGGSISAYIFIIDGLLDTIREGAVTLLKSNIYRSLGFQAIGTTENLLNFMVFVFITVLYAAYAVTLVAGWCREETAGRVELILSTPLPRWRLLVSHFGVALVALALEVSLTGLVFQLSVWVFKLSLDEGKAFGTFFGLWVIGVLIAGIGFTIAAINPGWAVGLTGGLVVVSYFAEVYAGLLGLPDWLVNLSLFHYYGRPIVNGLDWPAQFIMLGLTMILVSLAAWRFEGRDINRL